MRAKNAAYNHLHDAADDNELDSRQCKLQSEDMKSVINFLMFQAKVGLHIDFLGWFDHEQGKYINHGRRSSFMQANLHRSWWKWQAI